MARPEPGTGRSRFLRIAGVGAPFQSHSVALESATIVAGPVVQLTGNVVADGLTQGGNPALRYITLIREGAVRSGR